MVSHPISCQCGTVKGAITDPKPVNHVMCYCKDCQAFVHHIGAAEAVLDAQGGTEIMQMPISALSIDEGRDPIACLRLSPKGLARWYTTCCHMPLANTVAGETNVFVGVPTKVMDEDKVERDFGPVTCVYMGKSAIGEPKPKDFGVLSTVAKMARLMIGGKLSGAHKKSPFYTGGKIIAEPKILSAKEREAATPA